MSLLFGKRKTIIDTNSKEECERKEALLRKAGIRTNSWQTEAFPVLGGAHMKTADWAGSRPENKDDERIVYHIEVRESDQYRAMKVLMDDAGVPADGSV